MTVFIIQISIIIVDLLLLLLVYFGTPNSVKKGRNLKTTFLTFSFFTVLYLIVQPLYELVQNPEYARFLAHVAVVIVMFLGLAFFEFASVLSNSKHKNIWLHYLLVSMLAIFSFFTPLVEVTEGLDELTYEFNPFWYSLFHIPPLGYSAIGIRRLFLARHSQELDQTKKSQVSNVLYGMMFAVVMVFIGGFILPLMNLDYGVFFIIIGPSAIILILAYTIFALKLFNFRKFFYRAVIYTLSLFLVFTLVSLIAAIFFVAGFRDFLREVDDYQYALIVSVFSVIGLLIFQLTRIGLNRIVEKIYFRNSLNPERLMARMEPYLRSIDLKVICEGFCQVLDEELSVDNVIVYVGDIKSGSVQEQFYYSNEAPKLSLKKSLRQFVNGNMTLEEIEVFSVNSGFDLQIPFSHEGFRGGILIGHKESGRPIYTDERTVIQNLASDLSLAVQNSIQYEEIVAFSIKLEEKVETATKELRKSNQKLQALDEAKDEFISMASHQLRTPLTSVKGYISMVLEGDAGKLDEPKKKLLDEAFASSQRMVYLIADLLNVSRLKTGKFVIEPSEVDLGLIVEEEVHQLKPIAASRKLKIKYSKPRKFPKVWLDETKIRQVIMNFIDNAIYYTKAGGTIEVKLIAKRDEIEYAVTDNGIGVPKEQQAKLFTKFFRANNARKARPDGTGLGLYMARRVISAQGGSVLFESEEGKGSTFGFRFPLKSVKTRQNLESQVKANQGQAELSEE